MKMNRAYKWLVVVVIIQLTVLLYPAIVHEMVAVTGNSYKFKIQGYDPVDPFRGRYLAYMINTDKVHGALKDYTGTCYITLSKDQAGYTYLDEAVKLKPVNKDYIVSYTDGGNYYRTPFDKYYIDEKVAPKAEALMRERPEDCYIVVKSKKGINIVEGLYVGGELIEGVQ